MAAGLCERTCVCRCDPRVEIRLPGERDIQRLEPFRRSEQRHWRLGPWARCPADLSSELFGAGELQVIDGVSLDLCEQAERGVVRTCLHVGVGGGQRALRAPRRLYGQGNRMLKQCCRRGKPSAGLRPARGSLQLDRRFFVGSDGGYCEVPCAAIGIDFAICRSGERQVGCTPIVLRRSRVCRGSHEWVVKTHRRTDLEQLRVAGRGRRVRSDVQRPRRAPEEACDPLSDPRQPATSTAVSKPEAR